MNIGGIFDFWRHLPENEERKRLGVNKVRSKATPIVNALKVTKRETATKAHKVKDTLGSSAEIDWKVSTAKRPTR